MHFFMQIGVHYGGKFYEFVPWNGDVSWEISPWGYWSIAAENETHKVNEHLLRLAPPSYVSKELHLIHLEMKSM